MTTRTHSSSAHPSSSGSLARRVSRVLAVGAMLEDLEDEGIRAGAGAVGHRIVHGGPRFRVPVRATPDVLADLRRLAPLAPDHLPAERGGLLS